MRSPLALGAFSSGRAIRAAPELAEDQGHPVLYSATQSKPKLAIVVSHPIQYYVPLYQRLAQRSDLSIKVFFTWHSGAAAVLDQGFKSSIAWDIPLTEGYDFELVPNSSKDPGTHHFLGLKNPLLVERVARWRPDAVHITGWAWLSHVLALRRFHHMKVPTLFRGDSHLLDSQRRGLKWALKRALLKRVFEWPTGFLCVGAANEAYYRAFGVSQSRLFPCPHSVDVARFAEPIETLELAAAEWRRTLGIDDEQCVLLFAGKFEPKKRPIELMQAVERLPNQRVVLLMVGSGELSVEVNAFAAKNPGRFRVLPFQNQSRMPVVYRMGNVLVLPSAYGETWGLSVNEAMACGRPALVSSNVGCAQDVIDPLCGRVFSWANEYDLDRALMEITMDAEKLAAMGRAAARRAHLFDIGRTEAALMSCLHQVLPT